MAKNDENVTKKNITVYNKTDFFESEIKKKLDEVVFLCGIHKIPFFYAACPRNDEENGTLYVSDVVGAAGREVILVDDRISKHICVAAGFDVVPSRNDVGEELMDLGGDNQYDDADDPGFEGDLNSLLDDYDEGTF